jgi:hypothetical protein
MPGPDTDFIAGRSAQGARFDADPPAWSLSVKAEKVVGEADLYGMVS